MGRPDPIEYAERLYGAIRAANFSPLSFLAFGNAVKDGAGMRNMPRIAAEPFMRVVGEMLDLEDDAMDAQLIDAPGAADESVQTSASPTRGVGATPVELQEGTFAAADASTSANPTEKRRNKR